MGKNIVELMIKLGYRGQKVKKWQLFLSKTVDRTLKIDGYFGKATEAATKKFQLQHGLMADGMVGMVTLAAADSLQYVRNNKIRTEKQLMMWIRTNIGDAIRSAVKGTMYSEDWLGAIAARETGFLIIKYVNQGKQPGEINSLMKGDYRYGKYNGFGYFQIDIKSYPAFIDDGLWEYPFYSAKMAIICLDGKRNALSKYKYSNDITFDRAITAAYNCGAKKVIKAIENGYNIDQYTFNRDYSKEVFRMRKVYESIMT